MKTVLALIFLVHTLVHGHHHHGHHDDHIGFFWEDYTENSLAHAVKGGTDEHDKITYIGQSKHVVDGKEVLIPGTIYPSDKSIYEWNTNSQRVTKHFKILCTNYPDHMEWFSTDTEKVKKLLHEIELIEGGVDEHHNKIYIGRIKANDNLLLGKVLITNDDHAGYYTTTETGDIHSTSFEILSHVMRE
ncbi:hypothetical protein RN001_006972 [Aquatica leii]|uniref:Uncharacterized protein n=1 Tax=Aquatica leii TaxID=1421715 RepID=A0AAN7QLM8_9COLE|nr:hypothetical protein RN001_006972 [Aquatica leii]